MCNDEEVTSVSEYLAKIEEITKQLGKSQKHLFYRGHSNSAWTLLPSVFRKRGNKKEYNEKEILLDFKQYAPMHDVHYDFIDDRPDILAMMQHHGIPTRLLDWTVAPFNALFFACLPSDDNVSNKQATCCSPDDNSSNKQATCCSSDDNSSNKQATCCSPDDNSSNKQVNGEVIVFNPWKYWKKIVDNKKHPEIHQIHIMARALLSGKWEFEYIRGYLVNKFQYINITPEDILHPLPYVAHYNNPRIFHQRGAFTIHGLCRSSLEKEGDYSKRLIIPACCKDKILDELNSLYINHYSVFPDFAGMRKMISRYGSLFNVKSRQDGNKEND